jgi:hypothetical protein
MTVRGVELTGQTMWALINDRVFLSQKSLIARFLANSYDPPNWDNLSVSKREVR